MATKETKFSIEISAKAEEIWFALWDDFHYRKWTSVFCEGSFMKTDWKEGGKVHFLSPGGNGMYSLLEKNVPNEKMDFKHIGEIKEGIELPLTEETNAWSGARENYSLENLGDRFLLKVTIDMDEKHADYFNETFPKGLKKVKELAENLMIVVKTEVLKDIETVWNCWNQDEHISHWYFASEDWCCPNASNDLKVGGHFNYRMEAKDGSFGFDYEGIYSEVIEHQKIAYSLADNRKIIIEFSTSEKGTFIKESFHPENENPYEMQRFGWQAILDNFKKYCESL
jgi:uncharacterized protein YndB with AHSA1/START domain